MPRYFLAIDQGTTNSRAIVFNDSAQPVSQHEMALQQSFPHDGWVEQDPMEMWSNTLMCCRMALQKIKLSAKDIVAVGISNQRETTILWDKKTGIPIYPAIVWQDRRTADICERFSQQQIYHVLPQKTGLLLDPYFSATKILWLLENVPHAREKALRGELAFGTVDSYLLWQLTDGKVHATDATNASRTLLFNIHTQEWDTDILAAFNIPAAILPAVLDSAADFGESDPAHFGHPISISAILGDQQAATVGQACFLPGMVKATYGTGGFMLVNTGSEVVSSKNQLLSTIAYRLNGEVTYGLEGSIFSTGTTVKWLRDDLRIIETAAETETLARSVSDTGGVYLVPAFTGLGAPYWNPNARGAILGLTRNSSRAHIVRAALEAVVYQTRDLLECMQLDGIKKITTLRVDGGMAVNNWLLQFLSDVLNIRVERPHCVETSAMGAIFFAGLQKGVYASLEEISQLWQVNKIFKPDPLFSKRDDLCRGWQDAVARIVT